MYPITHHGVPCGDFLLTALTLYHILSGLSRGFLHFFSSSSQPLLSTEAVREFFSLPLTLQIIAPLPTDFNRQNTQNRDFYFLNICATFLLTNCWRYVIMEICAPGIRGRAAEFVIMHNKKAHRFCKPKPKAVGKMGLSAPNPVEIFGMNFPTAVITKCVQDTTHSG